MTPGGYCCTSITDDGFVWDYAGHFFHFSKDETAKLFKHIMRSTGEIIKCKKNTKIWYQSELIDYPFQNHIHQLDKDEFIDCMYDLFFKSDREKYVNFEDMLYSRFGRSITEKFLKPYNEKLYACDLKKLAPDAMGRFFPNPTFEEVLRNMKSEVGISYNDEFLYPKKGAETFIKALIESISPRNVVLNTTLEKVDINNKYIVVQNRSDYYKIYYEKLINTMPFHTFLKRMDSKMMSELSNELTYNKVLVFNIGFDRDAANFSGIHWIYFPDKNINFYRVGFYSNILRARNMSIYVEIGFSKYDSIDVEAEYVKTIEALKMVGIIKNHVVVNYEAKIMNPAYVHINRDHQNKINNVMSYLNDNGIYSIGRYGAWKYCSIEDSMMDAIDLFPHL